METIYALASGSYRAGVAVVRVSGPLALASIQKLSSRSEFMPRHSYFLTFAEGDIKIDQGIGIYFKSPASFTGEEVVEYHLHGGRAVIDGLLAALSRIAGCRMALPGEFTKRAFENGKMDLTEAEAVADLIAAETESQRLLALDQISGSLSRLYRDWTDRLTKILAHQEADIEFPEDDLPQGLSTGLTDGIVRLQHEITAHLDDNRRGERLRDGVRVAIIGAPNAGKSSLLNTLARRDAAIVSSEAGTTRDIIEVHLDLGGYPVILADTAGLRDTDNKIEAEGIKRAQDAARKADIRIALFDATQDMDADTKAMIDTDTIIVHNKSDLAMKDGIAISAETGAGMEVFLKTLTARVEDIFKGSSGPVLTRARHREALVEALQSITRALQATMPELAAEDLRLALRAIGKVTGHVHVEELLDRIFRDFCIGK